MTSLTERYVAAVNENLVATGLAWSVTRLGARAEFRFCSPAPRNGAESADAEDEDLDEYMHLYLANRDVLLTPFHNMALTCPATTDAELSVLIEAFRGATAELVD